LPGRVKCGGTEGEKWWLMAAGREKANMWHGKGNSGGSWPPAFPRSPELAKLRLQLFVDEEVGFSLNFQKFIIFCMLSGFI